MDSSAISWLSEMDLDDSAFMEQCDFLDSFNEDVVAVIRQDLENCLSAENNSPTLIDVPSINSVGSRPGSPQLGSDEPPTKLQKPNDFSNFSTIPGLNNNNNNNPDNRTSSTPIILNFGNADSPENPEHVSSRDEEAARVVCEEQYPKGSKKSRRVRPPSQTYDHIIAERKRREQLSQRFVILSTIVPGLKKMDKTSVLGDAIKYLKQLQERVKTLEEQATKHTIESVVFVKRSQVIVDDDDVSSSSSDEKTGGGSDELPLPEIEARVCNNRILLRVQCEKQKGLLANLLDKIEKLNLVVVSTNVATFGRFVLDISVIAEMEKEFNLTAKEVVKRLRTALHSSKKS